MVAPNESFGVHLGVDPGIKVEYRPVKKHRVHRFVVSLSRRADLTDLQEQSGLISKVSKMTVAQKTVLRNNKSEDVVITMFEQLPKSNDTDVRVKLVEPDIVPFRSFLYLCSF